MSGIPSVGSEKVSRATFAALLAVSGSTCTCEVCQILKNVVQELKAEFVKA